MKYCVSFRQTIDGSKPLTLAKIVESTEQLVRYLGFMEEGDVFELLSIVPIKE